MKRSLIVVLTLFVVFACLMCTAPARAECKESISDLFKRVSPSIVLVSAMRFDPFKLTGRFDYPVGTGFLISADGLIMTSSHLVYGTSAITVTFGVDYSSEAVLIGADPVLDIALLRLPNPPDGLPVATLGDSDKLEVGEEVMTIGNPLGFEKSLAHGIVSGINRILPVSPMSLMLPLIQTDAAVNPGNSGGPLINRCGEVVGITTSLLADVENISFAVPINIAKTIVPQLIESGRVLRPWIGIRGRIVVAEEFREIFNVNVVDGLLVETVDPGSPADKAGLLGGQLPAMIAGENFLLGGDIIFSVNGHPVEDDTAFEMILSSLKIGDKVRLGLYRHGQRSELELTATERPLLPQDLPTSNESILFQRGIRLSPKSPQWTW
jgi:serine protease Do